MECCDFDYRLQAPFCLTISGPTQSGKTTIVKNILLRRYELISVPIDNILYCYTEYQPAFDELKTAIPSIQFHQGLPDEIADPLDRHKLVILDDLMEEICSNKSYSTLFTRTSHHRNVSIIYLTQSFFEKAQKILTRNCQYICFTKNPREVSQVHCFGRQLTRNGKQNKALEECYQNVLNESYGHVFIDLHMCQNDLYRIRDSIFPEKCVIFKSN